MKMKPIIGWALLGVLSFNVMAVEIPLTKEDVLARIDVVYEAIKNQGYDKGWHDSLAQHVIDGSFSLEKVNGILNGYSPETKGYVASKQSNTQVRDADYANHMNQLQSNHMQDVNPQVGTAIPVVQVTTTEHTIAQPHDHYEYVPENQHDSPIVLMDGGLDVAKVSAGITTAVQSGRMSQAQAEASIQHFRDTGHDHLADYLVNALGYSVKVAPAAPTLNQQFLDLVNQYRAVTPAITDNVLRKLMADYQSSGAASQTMIDSWNNRITALTAIQAPVNVGDLNSVKKQVSANEQNIQAHQQQLDSLQPQVSDHATRIVTLESDKATHQEVSDVGQASENRDGILGRKIQETKQEVGAAVTKEEAARIASDADLKRGVIANGTAVKQVESRVDVNESHIARNSQRIDRHDALIQRDESELADHESRISSLEQMNQDVSGFEQQVQKNSEDIAANRKIAAGGISEAMAMSAIPQVGQDQRFSVGVGAGSFDGGSAIAVGVSASYGEHLIAKAGVSAATSGGVGANIGVSYGW